MIHRMLLLLLAALFMAQAPAAQTAAKGAIKGTVVAADTGAPVSGIPIVMRLANGSGNASFANSDERGNFEVTGLEPGAYFVAAEGISTFGYARQSYGSPIPGMEGSQFFTPVAVNAGQTTNDIVLRLSRGGSISGRILGANGQPFVDADVRIHRARFNESGAKLFVGEGMPVKVNDRGEYRFSGIDPGAIYLHAGPQIGLIFSTPGGEASRYAEDTYYPRAATFGESQPIEIKSGSELTNMDIQLLPRPPVFSISGRIVDSRTGQAPERNIQPDLVPRDREVGNMRGYLPVYGPNGTFTLNEVVEGDYWIGAQLRAPMVRPAPGQPVTIPPGLAAFQRITVRGADVTGVVLTFAPSVEVSGRVQIEGQLPAGFSVQLDLVRNGAFPMNMAQSPKPVPVGSDGSFRIADVTQGEYRLKVSGLPSGVYLKEAKTGGVDLLLDPVTILAVPPDRIEVSLQRGDGKVQGRLVNSQNQPVPNAQVVLIPDKLRDRADLFKTAKTDASGAFNFSGILPGEYKAFAWENAQSFRYFDKDFLKKSEDRGEPVVVENGTSKSITVRQIP
jgi:protocatechuate 3,4-dioxygenase beta subunit